MVKASCLLWIICFPVLLFSQDHEWWANNVNWNGTDHWSEYIIHAPRFLGPNALPIPQQNDGFIGDENKLSLGTIAHFTKGDQTQNLELRIDYVLVPDKISFDLYWVPIEYFQVSHERKTERKVFHLFYDDQLATGDIHLNTNIQLLQAEKQFADLSLRIGYRFASSNLQGAARFTDAPGYYFDLGMGKDYSLKSWTFRPSLMLGLMVWQTNRGDQFQNDAFLFGVGSSLQKGNFQIQTSFRGYLGYLNDGDKPLVLDLRASQSFGLWQVYAYGSLGFQDNLYDSLGLGLALKW